MAAPLGTNPRRPTAIASDGLNMYSRFPVGPITRQAWDACFGGADTSDGGAGDCLAMKGFSMASVTVAEGITIDIYDLHAEAGSKPADLDASASDYRELAAYITNHSAGHAIIVAGDTNLNTTDNPDDIAIWQQFLQTAGLADICSETKCTTQPGSIDKYAFRSSTAVTLDPLDRVVETERFLAPGTPALNDGQLSDHEAVSARWRWTLI